MKHFFPANNTSKGFVNYFDGITPPWENVNRMYILKGGPGVGKNTFMHKLEERALEKGYHLEYYHCASDCESLDALKVCEPGIIMVDGTAPHIIDPVFPGAVDNILNLGTYLNEKALGKQAGEIKSYQKQNSSCYRKAFAYLKAAGTLAEHTDFIYNSAIDTTDLYALVKKYMGAVGKGSKQYGQTRKLFAGAYSPQGYVNYISTIAEQMKILRLTGPSAAASRFMEIVIQLCGYEGLDCELFADSLLPEKLEHVIVPELNLCITTDTDTIEETGTVIALNDIVEKKLIDEQAIAFNEEQSRRLTDAAVNSLKQAKSVHDKLEAIYKNNMDFEQSTQYIDSCLNGILK